MGASDFAVKRQLLLRRHARRPDRPRRWRTSPSTTTGRTSSRCSSRPAAQPAAGRDGDAVEPAGLDEDQRLDDRRHGCGRTPTSRSPTTSRSSSRRTRRPGSRSATSRRRTSRCSNPADYPGMDLQRRRSRRPDQELPRPRRCSKRRLSTGILGYDHNWDVISYPETLYADPATARLRRRYGLALLRRRRECPGGRRTTTTPTSRPSTPSAPAANGRATRRPASPPRMGLVINATRELGPGRHPLEHGPGRRTTARPTTAA